jgi:hypothetical protein
MGRIAQTDGTAGELNGGNPGVRPRHRRKKRHWRISRDRIDEKRIIIVFNFHEPDLSAIFQDAIAN